ncbi:MAG: tetratricopeptide repeat protein [Pseudomonadota bacterium]
MIRSIPFGSGRAAASAILCLVVAGCTTSHMPIQTGTGFAQGANSPAGWLSRDGSDLTRGKIQFDAGHYGLAEQHFRAYVERYGASVEGWIGLAAAYDQLGRFDLADRAYGEALELAGRTSAILNNQGYSHYLRGDTQTAHRLFLEALALAPADPRIMANLELLTPPRTVTN